MNAFIRTYDFDNFGDPYIFGIKLKNGAKFNFLNVYYEYYFYPKEYERILYFYSLASTKEEAENNMDFSSKILQYLCCAPIYEKDSYVNNKDIDKNVIYEKANISKDTLKRLEFVSNKVVKFNVERKLFSEVIDLNNSALSNLVNFRYEDTILYYFKVIEKLAKKNYTKFYEKNYTKKVKQNNKKILHDFIEEYFNKCFKVKVTDNMLNTVCDELYIKFKECAYSSIFLKISFFCNCKKISIDLKELNDLVKIRNKLAHGDSVDEEVLEKLAWRALWLSNDFIAAYFFNTDYYNINIETKPIDF